ncbi:hypothetical protein Nepgr_005285 [Nepenthes gracilis]|uniref:Uncharacterized protein n=1 Tax=Nepenthes gracilis TaxID=150966 RepID=A0AAD3S324_NEPGR|nr:hypothetical protein Nepgr_005285 [Nepenthes gracilis]
MEKPDRESCPIHGVALFRILIILDLKVEVHMGTIPRDRISKFGINLGSTRERVRIHHLRVRATSRQDGFTSDTTLGISAGSSAWGDRILIHFSSRNQRIPRFII